MSCVSNVFVTGDKSTQKEDSLLFAMVISFVMVRYILVPCVGSRIDVQQSIQMKIQMPWCTRK